MPLPLARALAVANTYATAKAAGPLRCVHITPGRVRATNGHGGCDIPCEAVTIEAVVDCTGLRKMVDAVGDGVTIRVDKKSPLKVFVEAGGARYGLQSLAHDEAPANPEPPVAGWRPLSAAVVRALVAVSNMAGRDEASFALSGLRLMPGWFGAATGQALGIAWVPGTVDEPITVPAGICDGLEGECECVMDGGKFWIRETKSGQARWTVALEGTWPDSIIDEVLSPARAAADRVAFVVDAEQIVDLAAKADVVADGLGRVLKFIVDKKSIVFEKKGRGSAGDAEFRGTIEINGGPATTIIVGMEPGPIGRACGVIAAVMPPGEAAAQMSVAGPMNPILAWGGDPVVEVLIMPFHLGE